MEWSSCSFFRRRMLAHFALLSRPFLSARSHAESPLPFLPASTPSSILAHTLPSLPRCVRVSVVSSIGQSSAVPSRPSPLSLSRGDCDDEPSTAEEMPPKTKQSEEDVDSLDEAFNELTVSRSARAAAADIDFFCPPCHKEFTSDDELQTHIRAAHGVSAAAPATAESVAVASSATDAYAIPSAENNSDASVGDEQEYTDLKELLSELMDEQKVLKSKISTSKAGSAVMHKNANRLATCEAEIAATQTKLAVLASPASAAGP